MENIQVTDFSDAPYHRPEIRPLLVTWHALSVPVVLGMVMLRNGSNEQEVKKVTDAYRETTLEIGMGGKVFRMTIVTLVAQKKR